MMPFGNMDPRQMIQQALQRNPNVANNPQAQEALRVIMSGDAQRGQELARNYCQSFGVTPEEGVQQAQQYFQKNQRNIFGNFGKMFGGG